MESIVYEGEHLLFGKLGHLLIIIGFVASIAATLGFYKSFTTKKDTSWLSFAKTAFTIHSAAVISAIAVLFYMIINQYFEYHYVWHHSSSTMPLRYVFSSFWEGQEGSFMLWMFWHSVLGLILMKTAKRWTAGVMMVFSSVQIFLTSMVLGVLIFEYKLGSSPFTLLIRNHPDFMGIPLFDNPNYLDNLDGRGLNPLLQNYWMTIHPPTLFLGFALTLIPFSYALTGFLKGDYNGWKKPVLPWAFLGIGVLGVGILMGGAWAYESLSFGGFWAWDPVENASLAPWLVLVAAGHLMLIRKLKGSSLIMLFGLTTLQFLLVLYSTFLTRSGVLGESSVHSFTDLGMSGQLLIYLLTYCVLVIGILIYSFKKLPKTDTEDALMSREFWMTIGSMILLISAFQISFTTSQPVTNKLIGPDGLLPLLNSPLAPPQSLTEHYHAWQVPFAIVVCLLMAVAQFLRYRKTDLKTLKGALLVPAIIAIVLTSFTQFGFSMTNPFFAVLLFAGYFSMSTNFSYWRKILKGKIPKAGASIAHVGFALLIVGTVISMANQQIISRNNSGVDVSQLGDDFNNQENILLSKGDTLQMGEYYVSYKGKKKEGINIKYEVEYLQKTAKGLYETAFVLTPFIQLNERMGNAAEPSTQHYLHKDIYSFVTYADIEIKPEEKEGYQEPKDNTVNVGDTIFTANSFLILERLYRGFPDTNRIKLKPTDIAVIASFKAIDMRSQERRLNPAYVLQDSSYLTYLEDENKDLGIKLLFDKIDTETGEINIKLFEAKANKRDFIIMKAIIFPFINILWIGCLLMAIGSLISVKNRFKLAK